MKLKIHLLPLMILIIMIPLVVNAETCDLEKITIDTINEKEKSNNVEEIEQPVIEGKNIKVNLKMMNVGDSIEYKLLIKNDSNEDYELDKNNINSGSKYIDYTLNTDDNSLVVKAKTSKEVNLKVQYKNAVPATAYNNNGQFREDKSFVLNLSNQQITDETNTIKNPKTKDSHLFIMITTLILCIGLITYIKLNKKKYNKLMLLFLGLLLIIPASTYALCKIEITIDSKILIEKSDETKYEVAYLDLSHSLYTDEELAKTHSTDYTTCFTIYIGETKYNNCKNIIIKDENKYAAGEIANLKTINYKKTEIYPRICSLDSENIYHCPENYEIADNIYDTWYYDQSWNGFNYSYDTNDKIVMNFNNYINDKWDSEGYFGVTSPQSFTMPAHDVLFVNKTYEDANRPQ